MKKEEIRRGVSKEGNQLMKSQTFSSFWFGKQKGLILSDNLIKYIFLIGRTPNNRRPKGSL